MRTSRAEREQAIEVLKTAFVQGRLAKDEFEVRAGQALAARKAVRHLPRPATAAALVSCLPSTLCLATGASDPYNKLTQ